MTSVRVRLVYFGSIVCLLAIASFALHPANGLSNRPRLPWKNGFWVWAGEPPAEAAFKPDLVYIEVVGPRWPKNLPASTDYIVVRRIEPGTNLTRDLARLLTENYKRLIADAGAAHIIGLQIDYDSPASKLKSYGEFLHAVRKELPPGSSLSITALLDWFRSDRSIAQVLPEVDEYVPQFYDTASRRESAGIATPVDALKWAPIFNGYRTPYRIGIATFGRVSRKRGASIEFFRDASPLDFAGHPDLTRFVRTNATDELIVHYDVRSPPAGRSDLQAGDAVEITFPTEASVKKMYDAVRQFGGYCAGAIFFRWPTRSEGVTYSPDDVQRIIRNEPLPGEARFEARDAVCLERHCQDLYLDPGSTVHSEDRVVETSVDGAIELFLPNGPLQSRSIDSGHIAVRIPAYSGFGKTYLGRAILEAGPR